MSARVSTEVHARSRGPVAGGWLIAVLAAIALCGALFGGPAPTDSHEPAAAFALRKVSAL